MTGSHDSGAAQVRWVPAIGAGRKTRALMAGGWSQGEQARRSGLSQAMVWELVWDRREWITRTLADAVGALYRALKDVPGGSAQARHLARRHGWPPPAAWSDDTIDLPTFALGDSICRPCPYCGGPLHPGAAVTTP